GDVACRTTHDLDEMPVLLGRKAVPAHVARQLGINLGGGIKTEAQLDLLVLQVAVDGLGTSDNPNVCVFGLEKLSQHGRVGVGIIPTHNYQGVNPVLQEV